MVNKRNNSAKVERSPKKLEEPQRISLPYSFNTPFRVEMSKISRNKSPTKAGYFMELNVTINFY